LKVQLTRSARKDISGTAQWYEGQREGLGRKFLDRVDEALGRIGLNPLGYPKFSGENRRCNLETFPYALFFKIKDEVIVVACLFGGRDPKIIRERGSGVIPFPEP
jgi:hypothetical protein